MAAERTVGRLLGLGGIGACIVAAVRVGRTVPPAHVDAGVRQVLANIGALPCTATAQSVAVNPGDVTDPVVVLEDDEFTPVRDKWPQVGSGADPPVTRRTSSGRPRP